MGISTLDEASLSKTLSEAARVPMDVLYFADSYGSLTASETREKLAALRAAFPGQLGVHMHENLGLALANTLAAVDDGVDFVDATLAGMGRGAGNTRMEQLLLALYARYGRKDLNPSAVLPALREWMLPMQARYGWGWDFTYMLSGLIGIHPTYCQELKTGSRYELEEVAEILEAIPHARRARFDLNELVAAENRFAEQKRVTAGEVAVTTDWQPTPHDEVLIVAGGPSSHAHAEALRRFIASRRPLVVECNDLPFLDGVDRTTVVMNSVRAHELVQRPGWKDGRRNIVTGLASLPSELVEAGARRVDYSLERGAFDFSSRIALPSYVVGMLAAAVALQCRPSRIWLAGFDGFPGSDRRAEHDEMETFWALLRAHPEAKRVSLVSVLPTHYALPTQSVYAY